jgi:hypothetical protein
MADMQSSARPTRALAQTAINEVPARYAVATTKG